MEKMPIARLEKNEQGEVKTQLLITHLIEVAQHAEEIGKDVHLGKCVYCIGLLHDLGKSYQQFQQYVLGHEHRHVNHSSIGGIFLSDRLKKDHPDRLGNLMAEMLSYAIYAHHGLFDLCRFGDRIAGFDKRRQFNNNRKYNDDDFKRFFREEVEPAVYQDKGHGFDDLLQCAVAELRTFIVKVEALATSSAKNKNDQKDAFYYYLGITVRLLVSILKEADVYNSANAFRTEKSTLINDAEYQRIWSKGVSCIEQKYESFKPSAHHSPLNTLRSEIAADAQHYAHLVPHGSLRAELPTGAGKTLLTTRFALHNCATFKKKRFIYVTAFLSVLEQNAGEIKRLFEHDTAILEHHSNVVDEWDGFERHGEQDSQDNTQYYDNQYMIESWETPIILTTMVQYMNTLFKGKSSHLRRFCKLIDSVIVLDEVQNLPTKIVHNFNLMNNYLSEIMGATIIHCTATQPEFDSSSLAYPAQYSTTGEGYLAVIKDENAKVFERVRAFKLKNVQMDVGEISAHIRDTCKTHDSILIIASTKKAVRAIYDHMVDMQADGFALFFLTTNQCAADRLEKIGAIKKKLNANEKVLVVSSQLIEAGVDLDFSVVYRSVAGIASLIQAMGRCNREGKLPFGLFFIFDYAEENLSHLQELKIQKERTLAILSSISVGEVNILELKKKYFEDLYKNARDKNYPVKVEEFHTNLLTMLSTNVEARNDYKHTKQKKYPYELAQSFKTASEAFRLIEETGETIIVQMEGVAFGENGEKNQELVDGYRNAIASFQLPQAKAILRQLQSYTINIHQLDDYTPFVERIGEVTFLLPYYYDKDVGLNCKELELLVI